MLAYLLSQAPNTRAAGRSGRCGVFQLIDGFADGVVAVRGIGWVTADDHWSMLGPGDRCGPRLVGGECGSISSSVTGSRATRPLRYLTETGLGLEDLGALERIAVVPDTGRLRAILILGPLIPGEVREFGLVEKQGAREWIERVPGLITPRALPHQPRSPTDAPAIRTRALVKHSARSRPSAASTSRSSRGRYSASLGRTVPARARPSVACWGSSGRRAAAPRSSGWNPRSDGVAVRRRIGYVPGELRLPERMTGIEFVACIGRLRGGFDPASVDGLPDVFDSTWIARCATCRPAIVARWPSSLAFAPRPELLVLDEPTSGLDPLMQHEFLALVAEASARGATVFLSSHVLSEVQRAADRVAVLRPGGSWPRARWTSCGATPGNGSRCGSRTTCRPSRSRRSQGCRRSPSMADV